MRTGQNSIAKAFAQHIIRNWETGILQIAAHFPISFITFTGNIFQCGNELFIMDIVAVSEHMDFNRLGRRNRIFAGELHTRDHLNLIVKFLRFFYGTFHAAYGIVVRQCKRNQFLFNSKNNQFLGRKGAIGTIRMHVQINISHNHTFYSFSIV